MRDELEAQLERAGRRGHRALAAGVIRDGRHACAGWSTDGAPPDDTAIFEIGSITKAFTGVLLAEMSLRGEVALEDPLSRHLPAAQPAWRDREPTLLELATHRSGLPNVPRPMGRPELLYALGVGKEDPWARMSEPSYRELVARESPRGEPGRRIRYSSMGFGLLGDALAARAGKPYDELLGERVLAPLVLGATAVTVAGAPASKLLEGHSRRGRPRPPLEDLMPAAGSLRSSTADMLRFLAACLEPPDTRLGRALELAQRPQARIAKRIEIGLGWMIASRPRHPRMAWHNGGTWGFRSFAGFAPEQATAAVVMSNTARGVDRLGLRLAEQLDPAEPPVG